MLMAITLLPGSPVGTPIRPVNMTLSTSPSPTSSKCDGCVQPLDTLCWEGPPRARAGRSGRPGPGGRQPGRAGISLTRNRQGSVTS